MGREVEGRGRDAKGQGVGWGVVSLSIYMCVYRGEVVEGEVANMCQCNETHINTPNFEYLFCGILPLLFSR